MYYLAKGMGKLYFCSMKRKGKKRHRVGRFATVTTCISITLVLLLLGIVVMFVGIGTNFNHQLREEFTLNVVLSDSISATQIQTIKKCLVASPYARKVNYISKEQGTREMNAALQGDMGSFVGASPIPSEFEVYLKSSYANLDSIHRYEASIKAMQGVADLDYPRDVMENIDRTIPFVGIGLLIVAALLTIVSFSLINNTIRMNIYARRYSIHTMKLVGAKWSFIRRPFLWQALRIGIVAVVIAGGILGGGLYYMQYVIGNGEVYFNELITPLVWGATLGIVILCGILMTLCCAFVSVNKHLRMSTDEMFLK